MEGWNTRKQPKDGFTPFSSNVVTYQARALLPFGTYTVSQNTRDFRPGLKKRPGLKHLDIYPIGGQVDLRPAYSDDDGTDVMTIMAASGVWIGAASIAAAKAALPNVTSNAESNASLYGPGVLNTGANWWIGRVASTHNLNRIAGTTCSAASLFIKFAYTPGYINAAAEDFGIALTESDTLPPYACTVGAALDHYDFITVTSATGLLADRKSITVEEYGSDYIVEIPFNAYGIAAINAHLSGSKFYGDAEGNLMITILQREYDIEWAGDESGIGGSPILGPHAISQRMDRYFPFLRLTVDPLPPCISIFQYNQMRSGASEILAYYANGDILSDYQGGQVARTDLRPLASGGDNSGYYPYSDGTPSIDYGIATMRANAPSYDSKWGNYLYRQGGKNTGLDWTACYAGDLIHDPPSWGVLDDILIIADGRGYAKFYGGEGGQPVKASVVVIDDGALSDDTGIFNDEWDNDGIEVEIPSAWNTTTSAFYLYTPVWATRFLVEFGTINSGTGTLSAKIWNGAAWVAPTALVDGTLVAGRTLRQDGMIELYVSAPGKATRLNGLSGYWIKFKTSSSTTRATFNVKALYDWQDLDNIWDGVLVNALEAKVYDDSVGVAGAHYTYANTAIEVSLLTSSDKVYFSCLGKPDQLYFDVGSTPNSGAVAATLTFEYWNGATWASWPVLSDDTEGMTQSGFIKMNATTVELSQKQAFQGSLWSSHWFRMTTSQTFGDDMRISVKYSPVLHMEDFGTITECMGVWKERCVYSFNKYPSWIYVTQNGTVNVLNGSDYAVLQAGDGRRHSVKAMKKFHNELMVWQEEKGIEGGCLTLFEGYSPATFGKLLLSSKIGTLNSHSVVIIDGALEASRSDYKAATIAYFISNYGIYMSDGQAVVSISAAIQNYFDPTNANCIRNGYQEKCWMAHDPTHGLLRMGLVTGSSATEPNTFPVYDLITKRWSFDYYGTGRVVRCMSEVSGSSSSSVQVSVMAGTSIGELYNATSTALNDGGDTAIDMQVRIELNDYGKLMELKELAVRLKRQAAGNCLFSVYENGVLNADHNKTIDMTAGDEYVTGDENYVDRLILGVYQEDMISIAFRNNVIDQDMYLYDFWLNAATVQAR